MNRELLIVNGEAGPGQVAFWSARRIVLVEVLVFSIVVTMLTAAFDRNLYVASVLSVINVLGYGVGMLAWCKADARERGYRLHPRFPLAIVFFGTAALIYYLFRSRGFARGLAGTGYFVLFAVVMLVLSSIFGAIVMIAKAMILQQPLSPAPPPPKASSR